LSLRRAHFLRLLAACTTLWHATVSAPGIQPHEVLLLVNESSQDSLAVANHYRHQRGVPDRNILYLSLPAHVLEAKAEFSEAEFTRRIWNPANDALQKRKLTDHVIVWAYSAGFPVRINSKPPVSLQGITFTRNNLPDPGEISSGQYFSPLFTGPSKPGGQKGKTLSLARLADTPFEERPIPSMMLAFTGSRGNTLDDSIQRIRRGVAADGTYPKGHFYFVQNDNVRSKARDWAFEDTREELAARGFQASIVQQMPKQAEGILGLMIGKPRVNGLRQNTYLPGSMVEHLTSHAANFHFRSQMKCTRWLEGGVSATCGTVTEPRAIWTKFPHPRFYVHYTAGTHIVESFFQSVFSPTQLLILGDPLLSPWRVRPTLQLVQIDELQFRVETNHRNPGTTYSCMLDGLFFERGISEDVFQIPRKIMTPGNHELRIIQTESMALGTVATQIADIGIQQTTRRITLRKSEDTEKVPIHRPIHLQTLAEEPGDTVALLQGFRLLEERPWAESVSWEIDPRRLGLGPVLLQAAARYKDGGVLRSEPLRFEITRPREGPSLKLESGNTPGASGIRIRALSPPPAEIDWMGVIPLQDISMSNEPDSSARWHQGELHFESTESATSLLLTSRKTRVAASSITARLLSTPTQVKGGFRMLSGIAFNYKGPNSFDFFAMSADRSEWILGEYGNGIFNHVQTHAARIRFREFYLLTIRSGGQDMLEGWVNGKRVLQTDQLKLEKGGAGLVLGKGTSQCNLFAVSPIGKPPAYRIEEDALVSTDASSGKDDEFLIVAREGEAITRKAIRLSGELDPSHHPTELSLDNKPRNRAKRTQ